ncbi:PREDICTED: serine/threonine-protein kinase HT1-like [Nicotiana attenuata]|uniref:serine/threonine-protein kinase HT1-like n=1 Tax=Nicotiana attenuata TaxID=49451 RepID=UPI000905A43B|nr:PREDICTED: serine/threonine-protein kinase HT1-like [Nicotiana attenuata]
MSCSEKSREREEEETPVGSVQKYVEGVSRNGSSVVPSNQLSIDERVLVDPKQLFIGTKIGEGAHGKVYEGRYGDQIVAIKVLNGGKTSEERASLGSRFVREVVMMSRVKHENLVKFIGACKDPLMVIVTELLPGMSLRKYLVSIRPEVLDLHVALSYALDIARAMECLHANGIIHRDLKPDNLLLTANQKSVKLADFGLAREETLTEMMTAETGTYRWMAPEVCI